MPKQLKAAVIGLGNMGRHHVRAYSELESTELTAVCDTSIDRAQSFSKTHQCNAYATITDLLENESLDLVSIAAPTQFHFDIASQCLTHNCHVLLEKPITPTEDEAQKLITLAKTRNRLLAIGHIERFNPAYIAAKDWITSGKLGRLHAITAKRTSPYPSQITDTNVVLDIAIHDIDLVLDLINEAPLSIRANTGKAILKDRADHVEISAIFPNNCHALIEANWISPFKERLITIHGTAGYLEINLLTKTASFAPYTDDSTANTPKSAQLTPLPTTSHDALNKQIETLTSAITNQTPLPNSAEAGLKALSFAMKCLN